MVLGDAHKCHLPEWLVVRMCRIRGPGPMKEAVRQSDWHRGEG